jgi:hypothetical protein
MLRRVTRLGFAGIDVSWMRLVLCALLASTASTTVSTWFWMHEQVTSSVTRRFEYGEKRFAHYERIRPEWRARIGANELVRAFYAGDDAVMGKRIARLFALGFLATGFVYLWLDVRAAPFLILGIFAALYYCGTPRAENTWYPWDVPALFFCALTLLLAVRRQTIALAAVILVAITFKETLLLMALLFAFYEGWTPRQRAAWAGGTFGAGLALRFALQTALGDPVLRGFKLVALLGYARLWLAGSYNEFRVFLEFLPGSLLLAWRVLDQPAQV